MKSGRSEVDKKTSQPNVQTVKQHIVEFVCDSGEGAQTAGQMFGTVNARRGCGVWTVEIIPAEIEPPARSRAGASGNRIRVGTDVVTNMGDEADVIVSFNDQVLYSRIDLGALKEGTILFLESKWATDPQESIQKEYAEALADFRKRGYNIVEVPMETECLKLTPNPRRGKNMWALGMLAAVYDLEIPRICDLIEEKFSRKGQKIIDSNVALINSGYEWGLENVSFRFNIPVKPNDKPMVVMNGNTAVGLGSMAAGMELVSMYPITPATSATHYIAAVFQETGGFVHQAEDEIAAIGFALGASYAGKTPITITSGPGQALKTEFMGLAVMAELPLVLVNVQRGGPSTGLPTRVEQGDLMASLYGTTGDAPKIVMAASTIEECFNFVIEARKHAEKFRGLVILLTDANLATGQMPFPRPEISEKLLSPPIDQSDWDSAVLPYDWDPVTGYSQRPVVGQKNGAYTLTGLAHDENSKIAYDSPINQRSMAARSHKLAAFQKTLKAPEVFGGDSGDLLVVGWGSTRGAIEETVTRIRKDGGKVSSVNLVYLSPLQPGLKEIFNKFKKVMTVEINYSDDINDEIINSENRRYAQLATVLRSATLVDIDCWSRVPGIPLPPGMIEAELRKRLKSV